ncbi:MAG: hypothetical protein ACRETB_13615, partial [Steroidobacteraceae bacterium]
MSAVPNAASAALIKALENLYDGPRRLPEVVRLGEPAVPAIEAILRGGSQSVYQARYLAADALAAIGGPASTAALIRALRDSVARAPDPVSLEAESVIVNRIADHLSASRDPEAAEALLEALRRRPYPSCARALGRLGEPRAIALLVRCLDDDAAREAAREALCRFGGAASLPVATLLLTPRKVGGLEPPSLIDARAAAAHVLGAHLAADVAPAGADLALLAALEDSELRVRVEAALALARRGASAALAARVLAAALGKVDWACAET